MENSDNGVKMREINDKIVSFRVLKDGDKPANEDMNEKVIITDVKLPYDSPARMKTLKAEGKKWYLTVVYHPNSEKPFALFCTTNHREKTVPISNAVDELTKLASAKGILQTHIDKLCEKIDHDNNINKLTRTVSFLLRHNVSIVNIVTTLDKVDGVFPGSFLFQIKKFLSSYIKDGEKVEDGKCADCGSNNVIYMEGCFQCVDCGSGHCG